MALFGGGTKKLSSLKSVNPRTIVEEMLKSTSGASYERDMMYGIFYQIIGFKGVKAGIGTSTLVANTAIALSKLGVNVCVIDTSILTPCQDVLLNTEASEVYSESAARKILDWSDLGITKNSVLHTSKYSKKIQVLSFYRKGIVDLLSTTDSTQLVELALSQLQTKFDIILIDICDETTKIASTCLQMSQKVFQVWNNSVPVLRNIENSLANNVTQACSMDKMKNVILSMTIDSIPTDWDKLFKRFRFKKVAKVGMSLRLAEIMATNKPIYGMADLDSSVQEYSDCITDIVCLLLNIDAETGKSLTTYPVTDIKDNTELDKSEINPEDYPEVSELTKEKIFTTDEYIKKYTEGGEE